MSPTRLNRILLAACLGLLPTLTPMVPALSAQGSQSADAKPTGAISGRVQNSGTSRFLNNARVSVKGTNLVALTDQFGSFRLPNVPAGQVELEAQPTGSGFKFFNSSLRNRRLVILDFGRSDGVSP